MRGGGVGKIRERGVVSDEYGTAVLIGGDDRGTRGKIEVSGA